MNFSLVNSLVALGIIIVGVFVALVFRWYLQKRLEKKLTKQIGTLINKIIFYGIVAITLISALKQFGVDLTTLLGAAGIAGIAIGFAAKTTISNMISGFLLLLDKSMVVGNYITINNTTGKIESVDLLTTYVRTVDNKLLRIPNENLVSNNVINTSFYPIRRIMIEVNTAKTENILNFFDTLKNACMQLELVDKKNDISFVINTIYDQSFIFTMRVFVQTKQMVKTRNAILQTIAQICEKQKTKAWIRLK